MKVDLILMIQDKEVLCKQSHGENQHRVQYDAKIEACDSGK